MVRWGQVAGQKPDAWFEETAKRIYHPEVYMRAVAELVDDGLFTEDEFAPAFAAEAAGGYKAPSTDFIDGKSYDGRKPNEYIQSFEIGLK
jgi:nitrate/nitrite transport system substrate-binding protein